MPASGLPSLWRHVLAATPVHIRLRRERAVIFAYSQSITCLYNPHAKAMDLLYSGIVPSDIDQY